MNVLILHGIMGKSGEHWGQWLCDELSNRSYQVVMPSLSDTNHPDREKWLAEVNEIMQKVGENTVIVAHSLGVTSALDYLENAVRPIEGLVSVSGFADDYGLELNSYFLQEKTIDFKKVNGNLKKAFVFFGDDDPYVPQLSLHKLAEDLKVEPIIIAGGGHLNSASGFRKFPKLLEVVLSI